MSEPNEPKRKFPRGCLIALGLCAAVALACGLGAAFLGWSAWNNPSVRLGARAAGAAMEMTQAAIQAPGAAEVRGAGCGAGMVYSPDRMAQFIEDIATDGGRLEAPEVPLVVCAVRTGERAPSCDDVARAAGQSREGPAQAAVVVWAGEAQSPDCSGAYDREGERARGLHPSETAFATITRPRAF